MTVIRKKVTIPIDDTLDAILFGKITNESFRDYLGNREDRFGGGAIVYAENACAIMKSNIAVVTKLSKDNEEMLTAFHGKHTKLYTIEDSLTQVSSVQISNVTPFKDEAFYSYPIQNSPFNIKDLPSDKTYNYIFVDGAQGDYDVDLIKKCASMGNVALDASAFIRKVNPKTRLLEDRDYDLIKELLPYCNVIKLTYDQCYYLTGNVRTKDACEVIKQWGANEVLVTKNNILCLLDKNFNYREEPIAEKLNLNRIHLDTTTFVTYVIQRITSDPITSLYIACALGTMKLKRPGPLLCRKVDIDHVLKFFYYFKPVDIIEPVDDDSN